MTRDVTPTGHGANKWSGTYDKNSKGHDLNFSRQQLATLKRLELDWTKVPVRVVRINVERESTAEERGWGMRGPFFEKKYVMCPIITVRRANIEIITPGGDQVWMKG